MSLWTALQVDRLGMTASKLMNYESQFLLDQMWWITKKGQAVLPGWKITMDKNDDGSRKVVSFYPPSKTRKVADLTLGSTKEFRYYTLMIYPGQIVGETFAQFQHATTLLLDRFSYYRMFHEVNVSCIEVAADSWTIPREAILPMKLGMKASTVIINGDGSLGEVVIGSVNSPYRARVYDKKRQLLEKVNVVVPQETLTRIEVVKRYTGLRACEIGELPNVFEGLFIVDLIAALDQSSNPVWVDFLADAEFYGIPEALTMHEKHRKTFRGHLKASTNSDWSPKQMWKGFPSALKRIQPVAIEHAAPPLTSSTSMQSIADVGVK